MPHSRVVLALRAVLLVAPLSEAHKYSNAHRHESNDDVLVPRKCAVVQEDVHYHDRHEFTGLGEYHRGIRDVSERSETERCGEGDEEGTLEIS